MPDDPVRRAYHSMHNIKMVASQDLHASDSPTEEEVASFPLVCWSTQSLLQVRASVSTIHP
jgi:hypothetical protein